MFCIKHMNFMRIARCKHARKIDINAGYIFFGAITIDQGDGTIVTGVKFMYLSLVCKE